MNKDFYKNPEYIKKQRDSHLGKKNGNYKHGKSKYVKGTGKTGMIQKDYLESFGKTQKREGNRNWKGGRTISDHGYSLLRMPEHPRAKANGYVPEQRIIMEKYIGRFLSMDEVVHHIDGNKLNNDLSNLKLMKDSEHKSYESTKFWREWRERKLLYL